MRIGFHSRNDLDDCGNPTGGVVAGTGFTITWQDGPLGRGDDRKAPNGAFVEDVIDAALTRIQFYQEAAGGKFSCEENKIAIQHLMAALNVLNHRTLKREQRKVEGTHTP